jgi:hypothetical protein
MNKLIEDEMVACDKGIEQLAVALARHVQEQGGWCEECLAYFIEKYWAALGENTIGGSYHPPVKEK